LDYAQARMYANWQGQFTSVDPLLASGRTWSPQSWNRYTYTMNNPLRYSDPTGLYEWDESAGGIYTDEELKKRQKDKNLSKNERKQAKRALDFRQRFRAALATANGLATTNNNLSSAQQASLQESVNSYSYEGDINGVFVGVRPNAAGAAAITKLESDDTTTITFNEGLKGSELVAVLAHEGRHSADITNWLNSSECRGCPQDLNHYLSGLTTSWTKKSHDIVDSLIGKRSHDIVDCFYKSPVNIGVHLISFDF
jgi:hypothetical protein